MPPPLVADGRPRLDEAGAGAQVLPEGVLALCARSASPEGLEPFQERAPELSCDEYQEMSTAKGAEGLCGTRMPPPPRLPMLEQTSETTLGELRGAQCAGRRKELCVAREGQDRGWRPVSEATSQLSLYPESREASRSLVEGDGQELRTLDEGAMRFQLLDNPQKKGSAVESVEVDPPSATAAGVEGEMAALLKGLRRAPPSLGGAGSAGAACWPRGR